MSVLVTLRVHLPTISPLSSNIFGFPTHSLALPSTRYPFSIYSYILSPLLPIAAWNPLGVICPGLPPVPSSDFQNDVFLLKPPFLASVPIVNCKASRIPPVPLYLRPFQPQFQIATERFAIPSLLSSSHYCAGPHSAIPRGLRSKNLYQNPFP